MKLLQALLDRQEGYHRHLDWRSPTDWLGFQPFWVLGKDGILLAALSCPVDPPGIAWVRLFVTTERLRTLHIWRILFEKARASFPRDNPPVIASLALYKWYADILKQDGFSYHHDIVVLRWNVTPPPPLTALPGFSIRPMTPEDLPVVVQLDNTAFTPLWRNSLETITRSFMQSTYSTMAYLGDRPIGYQISSSSPTNAHLARLAVEPGLQQHGLGTRLVEDLIRHFTAQNIYQITVNTQSNNHASLNLYQRMGFLYTGESFPVYLYTEGEQ